MPLPDFLDRVRGAQPAPGNVLLDRKGLEQRGITYSPVHLWRLSRAGKFPMPIKPTGGRNAWVASEVDAWIAERIAARDTPKAA